LAFVCKVEYIILPVGFQLHTEVDAFYRALQQNSFLGYVRDCPPAYDELSAAYSDIPAHGSPP
jgi:hypothetical protein